MAEQDGSHGLDLALVVTRLNRIRPSTRSRLANSELTRALLASALKMVEERFDGTRRLVQAADDERSPLAFLTRAHVLARTMREYPHLQATETKFRDRWIGQQDFLGDVVSYALAIWRQRSRAALTVWTDEALAREPALSGAVGRLTHRAFGLLTEPAYRLRLLAVASAGPHGADEVVREVFAAMHHDLVETHQRVLDHYGLAMRPGTDVDTLVTLVDALAEGLVIGVLAGDDHPNPDWGHYRDMLATGTLALFTNLTNKKQQNRND